MESFIGFVYPNGFNFAPRDYSFCAGQIIPISSNQALFALLGATFGGDGRSSMGLPDLRGRVPIGSTVMGSPNPPLFPSQWGEMGGLQQTTLSLSQLPTHTHAATFTASGGESAVSVEVANTVGTIPTTGLAPQNVSDGDYLSLVKNPGGSGSLQSFVTPADASSAGTVSLGGVSGGGGSGGTVTVQNTGNSTAIDIRNPYVGMSYVIAMQGIFPSRS